jgi:hypothetical protein
MSVWKSRLKADGVRALLAVGALASFVYALGAGRKW